MTRPPGYDEAVSPRVRTASGQPLHTIDEEQSVASRSETPEIPLTTGDTLGDERTRGS